MTTKKTAKKSTTAKPVKYLTNDQICNLEPGTDLELLIRVKFDCDEYADPCDPHQVCSFADMEGDTFLIPLGSIVQARIVPKPKVKVSGEGADRAAEILRENGFDVS